MLLTIALVLPVRPAVSQLLARIGFQDLTKVELQRPLERLGGVEPARSTVDDELFADATEALARSEVMRRVLLPEVRRRNSCSRSRSDGCSLSARTPQESTST